MHSFYLKKVVAKLLMLCLFLAIGFGLPALAQAPSSFSYPTPVVYSANVSNVFLSPNVAGGVDTYSMPASPALPAGLAFNTNTGIISGVPTAALATTVYTITAHNASGTANASLTMTVTTSYADAAGKSLSFVNTPDPSPSGQPRTSTSPYVTHIGGTSGQANGNVTLYSNVVNVGTVASPLYVDCIVTTVNVNHVNNNWLAYDQDLETDKTPSNNGSYDSNSPAFFSPQVSFSTLTASTPTTPAIPAGGGITFNFQFILHNTYVSAANPGTNITLQNVKLNTYDIDGNNNTNSYQFNEFGGFATSELGTSPTVAASYNTATGLTKFLSTSTTNSSTITAPATRVRVSYAFMSNFTIVVGAQSSGTAYFFLDFSTGPAFTSSTSSAPSIDLNTSVVGVNNDGSGCGSSFSFAKSGQTNLVVQLNSENTRPLTELDVTYPASEIKDGASEKLIVSGASGTTSYALDLTSPGTSITVDGVVYTVTTSTSGGINKIAFVRTGGNTMTTARMETFIDALRYSNESSTPTGGERKFTVNVLDGTFRSPDATYTANVSCVAIAGHIWRDADGLQGTGTISAYSPAGAQFAANGVYAVLVNPSNNQVIASQGVTAGGAYSFGTVSPGSYILYVASSAPVVGSTFTAPTYPSGGYVSVGENLGAGSGNDNAVDGKLTVTVGSVAITDANFGLDIAPVANAVSSDPQPNPGGTQKVVVPTLNGTDPEEGTLAGGVGNTVKITSTITNGALYYDGSPVGNGSIITNYDPSKLTVDPDNGVVTVSFTYQEIDAAGLPSPDATVNIPFTELTISGKVYHDADGTTNSLIDGTLISSIPAGQLYANLVYDGLVVATTPITDGGYSFNTLSGLQRNLPFTVVAGTTQGVVGTSTGATSTLSSDWVSTADGSGTGDILANGSLLVTMGNSSITTGLDFGIEQIPVAGSGSNPGDEATGTASTVVPASTFTNVIASTDPDGTVYGIRITAFPAGATSITIAGITYTNIPADVAALTSLIIPTDLTGQPTVAISSDPAAEGAYNINIPFVAIDNAGKEGTIVGHAIIGFTPLPVTLVSFDTYKEGQTTLLTWSTSEELNSDHFEIQHSVDAKTWSAIGTVASFGNTKIQQNYTFVDKAPMANLNYYRLKMIDRDGTFSMSRIRSLNFGNDVSTKIYPNPVADKLTIEAADWQSVTGIEIYSSNGRTMYSDKGMNLSNSIDIRSFGSGTYVLRLTTKNGEFIVSKITVSK